MRIHLAALACVGALSATPSFAQTDVFAGCEEIPIPVPSFSCADGYLVPKQVYNSKCEHPEDLYNRCVLNSRLGVLSRGEDNGVDIVFSCRTRPSGTVESGQSGTANQDDIDFYDIAAIQHERATGKTCFYQYLGNQNINDVMPAPLSEAGRAFWGAFGNDDERGSGYHICTSCHTNNAFIRTPHYDLRLMDVYDVAPDYIEIRKIKTDKGLRDVRIDGRDKLLPDIYSTQKYIPLNSNRNFSWIAEEKNSCNACHSIGYYYDVRSESYKLGKMNDVVSGYHHSLYGRTTESPSLSTYDDFMVEQVRSYLDNDCIAAGGGAEAGACENWRRQFAIDEVIALHGCVAHPGVAPCKIGNPAKGEVPYEAPGKIMRKNRPDDPSAMAGVRLMKRYGRPNQGYCLSAIGPDIRNGTEVKQVPCNKTYGNSQNWLYDKDRGLMRSAQHQTMCLTVRPLYMDRTTREQSFEHFSGAEVLYPYSSRAVLWDCNSLGPKGHHLNSWDWNGVQVIKSRQKPEFCLSGDDSYAWAGEEMTEAYVEPCTRNANGSFWILTTEKTVAAAVAKFNQ